MIATDRRLTANQFFDFCQTHPDLRVERSANGEISIMPPAGAESDYRSLAVASELRGWALRDGRGKVFGSSAGFTLPDGSVLSPDAAWVRKDRLAALAKSQKKAFPPLCPDFIVEVQSPSDSVAMLKRKMQEWIDNGAELGWLILPESRTAWVFRRGAAPLEHVHPERLAGEGPVAGFVLNLPDIWTDL